MVVVSNNDKGVQCDDCDRWFHSNCLNMTSSEYNKLASNLSLKWQCNRVDCNGVVPAQLSSTSSVLDEILKKMDSLATKELLEPISSDLAALKSNFGELSKVIADFEPRLNKVEEDVKFLLEDAGNKGNLKSVDDIYSEMVDRASRQSNIIIFNMPESDNPQVSVKKAHDLDLINKTLHAAKLSSEKFTFYRLGKSTARRPRPIKLILSSPAEARDFFRNFSTDNLHSLDTNLSDITVSHDRTPKEKKYLEELRKTLENRTKSGENDLTIKYINGTPQIVKKQKN